MIAMARSYFDAASKAWVSTSVACPFRAFGLAALKKRCMNTPSTPYSCIQLKWVSTVLLSAELKKRAVLPSACFRPVG